jgi:arginine utilization protein RocB
MSTESETIIGKLWRKADDAGDYLGGVVLGDCPSGCHVRLRKNRSARSKRDGEYLLVAVTEEKPKAKRQRKTEPALPPENRLLHSFIAPGADEDITCPWDNE